MSETIRHAGARLVVSQSGHPPEEEPHLAQGWRRMYGEPLARHVSA